MKYRVTEKAGSRILNQPVKKGQVLSLSPIQANLLLVMGWLEPIKPPARKRTRKQSS